MMGPLIAALALVALLVQESGVKPSVFDTPVGELTDGKGDDPLDRLSLNQMMRMAALPPQRMLEFQCAGIANWPGSRAWPVFTLTDTQRSTFVAAVVAAFANDLEIEKSVAGDLIAAYAQEPPYREAKGELQSYRAEVERDCGALMGQLRAGTYQLSPLAQPSVVNTTLATCYARYTVAAGRTKDKAEAESLRATAAKAEELALVGKQGEALAAARAALAAQVEANSAGDSSADEGDMMRLVMCLPAIDAAKKEQAK
jgi:hypothetical protein